MSIPVIGLGAGGHARVVIEILQLDKQYEPIGLLDSNSELHGQSVLGVPVLGGDEQLPALKARGVGHFFTGLGSASESAPRRRLYEAALERGLKPVTAVHPTAVISPSVVIGQGATVMAGAIINTGVRLGENVIVNTGVIIEHDCVIGAHAHVATGAILAGSVNVGRGTIIGAGAVVRLGLHVGKDALVGAGAVVVKDVPNGQIVMGNPARRPEKK